MTAAHPEPRIPFHSLFFMEPSASWLQLPVSGPLPHGNCGQCLWLRGLIGIRGVFLEEVKRMPFA